jgi:N4-gp56 family major capsid protein
MSYTPTIVNPTAPVYAPQYVSATVDGNSPVAGTVITQFIRDVYSQEILYLSQERRLFDQFSKKRYDLRARPGNKVVFTKMNNLAEGGRLDEHRKLQTKSMTASEFDLTVYEHGNAISVSEYQLKSAMFDTLNEGSKLLAHDYARTLDKQYRDMLFLQVPNTIIAGDKASVDLLAAADKFNVRLVKDAALFLAENNAPKLNGELYVCISPPAHLRQLRDDPEWISAHRYVGTRNLFLGEAGMFEGIVFIDSTQLSRYLSKAKMAEIFGEDPAATWSLPNNHFYSMSIVFGENAYARAVGLEVEMRTNPVEDFGRKHSLAWYGIWGLGLVEPNNIVRIVTA